MQLLETLTIDLAVDRCWCDGCDVDGDVGVDVSVDVGVDVCVGSGVVDVGVIIGDIDVE